MLPAEGVANLYARIERMRELGPTFIDITWGAGGNRADTTAQFVKAAHEEFGLETCMHLTCTDMPRDQVDKALEVCLLSSISHCLLLSTAKAFDLLRLPAALRRHYHHQR